MNMAVGMMNSTTEKKAKNVSAGNWYAANTKTDAPSIDARYFIMSFVSSILIISLFILYVMTMLNKHLALRFAGKYVSLHSGVILFAGSQRI